MSAETGQQPRSGASSGSASPAGAGGRSRSTSVSAANQHSPASANPSSLAASLKAFSDLSIGGKAPTTLQSAEFQQALGHARRASFTANSPTTAPSQTKPVLIPGLSASPTLSAADTDLPTPGSSPITMLPGAKVTKKAPSLTGVQLDGVCEQAELVADDAQELEVLSPVSPSAEVPTSPLSAAGSLFSGGARWGWPQSAKSTGGSSPPPPAVGPLASSAPLGRRASVNGGQTATSMGAPLGRVTSAGAANSSNGGSSASKDGLGLFRRFSVGGFGSRPKPPSPPQSSYNVPQVITPPAIPASAPPAVDADGSRGRKVSGNAAKTKRRVSPMGERMIRGFNC